MDLFERNARSEAAAPLADRIRPLDFDEMVGQDELLAPEGFLVQAVRQDEVPSLILWGPPGSGKTTLAHIVAGHTQSHFESLSAVLGGVAEVRAIVKAAQQRRKIEGRRTILFVDEIHRFNKAQQDAFLPHVEDGTVILIGATTENPSFEVISALLSRCRVVRLHALTPPDILATLQRALADEQRGLGAWQLNADAEALQRIATLADGDARRGLNLLEQAGTWLHARGQQHLTAVLVDDLLAHQAPRYDKGGDEHYDVASAFIKSLRGSDPDAAMYYMVRALEGGEPPRFLLRRMVIFAAEDVGNADPRALTVAVAAMQAFEFVGMPEGIIPMAQACTFLATAPKSNASYVAMAKAREDVRQSGSLPVPLHIRNAPTQLMKSFGYSQGYEYPHDQAGHFAAVHYLPAALQGRHYYQPSDQGYEAKLAERLRAWRQWRDQELARATKNQGRTPREE